MSMLKQQGRVGLTTRLRIERHTSLLLLMLAVIVAQAGCVLQHATSRVSPATTWRCDALLQETRTRERIRVTSDPPFNPLPASSARHFITNRDWNGDGRRDVEDAKTDWRRYIFNNILPSPRFAGRTWCVEPITINCTPTALPEPSPEPPLRPAVLVECSPEPIDARLEVSAPGLVLAAERHYRLSFPDTPTGLSSPVTITVRNAGTTSLRINSADFLGATRELDFFEPMASGDCLPTTDENFRGVGHELMRGSSCSFQVNFRPEYRPGVPECDRDDIMSRSCDRLAVLLITSESLSGRALPELRLFLDGRAIGGRLVVAPSEICFPTVPSASMCTEAGPASTITIRNEGTRETTGNLKINLASLVVPRPDFVVTPVRFAGITLAPGEMRTVQVQYCERGDTVHNAYRIFSSAPRNPTVEIPIINPNVRTCP